MVSKFFVLLASLMITSGLAVAQPQETRSLDAGLDGSAVDNAGDSSDVTLNVTGDVTVTQSGPGVDRTAYTSGATASVLVTIGDASWEISVTIAGEGVSLVQTGVSADAWRLGFQGTSVPGPDTRDAPSTAHIRGSLTLLGSDEGGYAASGDGVLTVQDAAGTTTYRLSYQGTATFE